MKSTAISTVLIVLLIGGAGLGVRSCQRASWEPYMDGPYVGLPFTSSGTESPVSVLAVPSVGSLEVYEFVPPTNPVLVLRSEAGAVQWSRLLVPEQRFSDGRLQRAGVRELRLKRLERSKHGYKVFFICDWDWGGKEGGVIDLDSQYEFKSFRISW